MTNAANGHVYYLRGAQTWTTAETKALSLGGHLVTINNATEQQWITNTFLPLAGTHYLWIGLTDRDVEGTYQWVSGETSTYRNWQLDEPNNAVSGNDNQDTLLCIPSIMRPRASGTTGLRQRPQRQLPTELLTLTLVWPHRWCCFPLSKLHGPLELQIATRFSGAHPSTPIVGSAFAIRSREQAAQTITLGF